MNELTVDLRKGGEGFVGKFELQHFYISQGPSDGMLQGFTSCRHAHRVEANTLEA